MVFFFSNYISIRMYQANKGGVVVVVDDDDDRYIERICMQMILSLTVT